MTLIQRNRRAKVLFLGGVFLACMCPLMLQVMETRLLSVIAWYYLAFFAISMAMFGLAANTLLELWWLDPSVALAISAICVREGQKAWRGEECRVRDLFVAQQHG